MLPPFTALRSVQTLVTGDKLDVGYGAQDLSANDSGAYTGEISGAMLAALACQYVVVGHSERRAMHGEDDAVVAAKAAAALRHGVVPIVCVGRGWTCAAPASTCSSAPPSSTCPWTASPPSRSAGGALGRGGAIVIAYEPVWAIGTGEVATPEDAQEVCGALRARLAERFGPETADDVRILYGGSVKAANTAGILAGPDVDGALVGGASLDADEFAQIGRIAAGGVGSTLPAGRTRAGGRAARSGEAPAALAAPARLGARRSRRRIIAAAAVVVLVVVVAVSCAGGLRRAGRRPGPATGPTPASPGSGPPRTRRGARSASSPPRSPASTRSAPTSRASGPSTRGLTRAPWSPTPANPAGPGNSSRISPPISARRRRTAELDVHAEERHHLRGRSADHLARHQVRHRAHVRLRRRRRRPHARGRAARRPGQPTPAPTSTSPRAGWASRPSRRRTTRRSSSSCAGRPPSCPTVPGPAVEQPGAHRGRQGRDLRLGPGVQRAVHDHVGRPGDGCRAERNPRWDPATDDVRTALPDRVVVRLGMSGLERDQALLAGSADVDISGTGIQPQTTARLSDEEWDDAALQDRLDDVTTGAVRLLAMPTDVTPMDVPACRQAVALVVDRAAVQDRLGGAGNAVRASQLAPVASREGPTIPTRAPTSMLSAPRWRSAGQPDGLRIVPAAPNVPSSVDAADTLADQLAEVGIEVQIQTFDVGSFFSSDVGRPDNVRAQGFGLVLTTWTADYPTPDAFLVPLVDGRSIRGSANTNYARLNVPEINALIDQARAAGDTPEGRALWRDVAAAARDTQAYVPLAEMRSSSRDSGCATVGDAALRGAPRPRHRRRGMNVDVLAA